MSGAAGHPVHFPSFIAETGGGDMAWDAGTMRPGTPLQLRAGPGDLLIGVETLDGRRVGRLPREDAWRLRHLDAAAARATVTGLVPSLGRTRVLIRLEIAEP